MDERIRFVIRLKDGESMAGLCGQSLRYWPRACHSWRSITRSEMLSRSTLAVTLPTGVMGWMTGPFNLKCSSHMSRRGSN